MFVEFDFANRVTGWIEVICGGMFSGKTEELIRRLRRAQIANQKVQIFKPLIDNRYSDEEVVSHNRTTIPSTAVANANDILKLAQNVEVVGIDEVQFFGADVIEVTKKLANRGIRVIVAGLDMDFRGEPFEPMPQLLAKAEFVTKVHAICQKCGSLAAYSFRLDANQSQVALGEKDKYEARCRRCFYIGPNV